MDLDLEPLKPLLTASPLALLLYALWKLPEWTQKWIEVARSLRDYRQGR